MQSIRKQTYWNGEPCQARAVEVIVGAAPIETWWCNRLVGKRHRAIEITQHGETFYINDDQAGRTKITNGLGSPQWAHRGLPVEYVLS